MSCVSLDRCKEDLELFAKSHITLLNKRLEWLAGIKGRMESEATSDPMLQPAVDFLRRVLSKIELHKQRVLESRTKRMNVYSNSDNFMVYPPQDQEKQVVGLEQLILRH